jgi:hypothetical protein
MNPLIKIIAEWLADEFDEGDKPKAEDWERDAVDFYNYLAAHNIRIQQAKRGSVGHIKERAVF